MGMKKDFIVTRSITMVEGKPHVETYSEQELVRCKDCKYYNPEPDSHGDYCDKIHWSRGLNWFCADGKLEES